MSVVTNLARRRTRCPPLLVILASVHDRNVGGKRSSVSVSDGIVPLHSDRSVLTNHIRGDPLPKLHYPPASVSGVTLVLGVSGDHTRQPMQGRFFSRQTSLRVVDLFVRAPR